MKKQLIIIGFIFSFIFIFSSTPVFGAKLYLNSAADEYGFGDTVKFVLRLDTEGECINAISGGITFPKNILMSGKFYYGDSLFSLWVKPPEIDQVNGKITFTGGIPGGYCGRISGDPGAGGVVGEIVFKTLGMSVGGLNSLIAKVEMLPSSQILLNDGLGTPAKLTLAGKTVKVLADKPKTPQVNTNPAPVSEDIFEEAPEYDKLPPEPFNVELRQDPEMFNDKYFIVFQTTDKQTGVDYYEVKEGDGNWVKAVSPYLLTDQKIKGVVDVRVWDKFGNFRLGKYISKDLAEKSLESVSKSKSSSSLILPISIISFCLFLFLVVGIACFAATRKHRR